MTAAMAPTAIPAFAPVDSAAESDVDCELLLPGEGVAPSDDEETLLPDGLVVVGDADDSVLVELGRPLFVETIEPSPFKTIPRFSTQHLGSLSQQKLPSEHCTTRGR